MRDREHRDPAAAGGTFGEFGIDLQLIVEAGRAAKIVVARIAAIAGR